MNAVAKLSLSQKATDAALKRVAAMAGRKFGDLAVEKAGPTLQSMNMRKVITLVAIAGVGGLVYRLLNKSEFLS
jgi:hypothetical protein